MYYNFTNLWGDMCEGMKKYDYMILYNKLWYFIKLASFQICFNEL